MKSFNIKKGLLLLLLASSTSLYAQDTTATKAAQPDNKPVRNTFENRIAINNQTVANPGKKSLDFVIQHRFGVMKSGYDLWGMFATSNIRLGLTYGINDRLALGAGATRFKHMYDFNGQYTLLKQTKSGSMPVTVSYFGDLALNGDSAKEQFHNQENSYQYSNRLSYFNEVMIARKFNSRISLQAAFTYSYYNLIDSSAKGGNMTEHGTPGISAVGRYRFSPQSSVIVDFDMPFTTRSVTEVTDQTSNSVTTTTSYYPRTNLGIGIEIATSGHQFQLFVCNANGIVNQEIRVYNTNSWANGDVMIGFNITRQWGF